MVSILKRMRKFKSLLDIRLGPGAAVLSGDVKRIHMTFAKKMEGGHMGPRKIWHECLPRLKYHNPAIPITVDRTEDTSAPAALTVFFADSPPDTQSPAPTQSSSSEKIASNHQPFDRTQLIEMKWRQPSEILEELLSVTDGKEVKATEEEMAELEAMAEQKRRSDHDREVERRLMLKRTREKEILEQARKSVEMRRG